MALLHYIGLWALELQGNCESILHEVFSISPTHHRDPQATGLGACQLGDLNAFIKSRAG